MCGRYASSRHPSDIVEEFEIDELRISAPLDDNYNVAPTDEVYAVVERPPRRDEEQPPDRVERQLRAVRWGLVPSWSKDRSSGARMINARMETVAEKPAYRQAFRKRRALVPADGYYEWYETRRRNAQGKPAKQPYFIRPRDGGLLAMAGLYEIWRDPAKADDDPTRFKWTMTVITTTAADELGQIHDRMPLMLPRAAYDTWLDPAQDDAESLLGLLEPAAPGRLLAQPVSALVSNVANNGPELVAPVALTDDGGALGA